MPKTSRDAGPVEVQRSGIVFLIFDSFVFCVLSTTGKSLFLNLPCLDLNIKSGRSRPLVANWEKRERSPPLEGPTINFATAASFVDSQPINMVFAPLYMLLSYASVF